MDFRLLIESVVRRRAWLFGRYSRTKAWNLLSAGKSFVLKRETMRALPTVVKIDISPLCNLRCTACVHADANGDATLEAQVFKPQHRMTLARYQLIINELKGKSAAVSLYYLGDPLMHPDLDRMCRIAADADLEVHISSNFSVQLDDARIRSLVQSGLSHLTVCIDGLTQEKYQRTRVGGNIARVIDNLERVCRTRQELGHKGLSVEVQYIMFQHNVDEMERARALCKTLGVDQFSSFWGGLDNWTGRDPGKYEVGAAHPPSALPKCSWPHFSTVIKWNGDVVPCCTFRHGSQYDPKADPRVFGNVFDSGLGDVWNSSAYQQARRLVADPTASDRDPALKKHFCDACPVLFETTYQATTAWADRETFEQRYALDDKGKPVRRHIAARSVAAG